MDWCDCCFIVYPLLDCSPGFLGRLEWLCITATGMYGILEFVGDVVVLSRELLYGFASFEIFEQPISSLAVFHAQNLFFADPWLTVTVDQANFN